MIVDRMCSANMEIFLFCILKHHVLLPWLYFKKEELQSIMSCVIVMPRQYTTCWLCFYYTAELTLGTPTRMFLTSKSSGSSVSDDGAGTVVESLISSPWRIPVTHQYQYTLSSLLGQHVTCRATRKSKSSLHKMTYIPNRPR